MFSNLPIDFIYTLVTIFGFVAIAWEGSKKTDKNPLFIVLGGAMLLYIMTAFLFGSGKWQVNVFQLTFDIGVGALIGGIVLLVRGGTAKSFMALGVLALVLSGAIYAGTIAFDTFSEDTNKVYPSYLLELGADDTLAEVQPILDKYHLTAERAFPTISLSEDEDLAQYYIISSPQGIALEAIDSLKKDVENVDSFQENYIVQIPMDVAYEVTPTAGDFLENDPLVHKQWGLKAIFGHEAHRLLQNVTPAKKALVAIVDTGVDGNHEDLKHVFKKSPGNVDGNGHGTHCAGIAGGVTNNRVGIASLNWEGKFVQIAGFSALSKTGSGTAESVAQAIIDATNAGADVISLSLGATHLIPPKVEIDAVEFALSKGAIVLAAAGNDNADAINHSPSNINGVISVAAVDQKLRKASFSNTNTRLSQPIAAPGVEILSTKPRNNYVAHNGTSMATPMVSGLVGVMRALQPNLSARDAYQIILKTGQSVRDSKKVGKVINAEAALRLVLPPS